ncbi:MULTISPECIES: hypothetical protein [unclassified Nocardiopsis]|uniref:hypothetical protein n=1 Tax=unclassified Nocardiopsis TaxID=2649073 RepID=UPI001F260BF8|nr:MULTISPECIES: hypothetical protein [unclassified Nocardiopsis]
MRHPPEPILLQPPEAAGAPRMPLALRALRVLFSLSGTFSAIAALYYVFLLLIRYVYPYPGLEEWLAAQGHFTAELSAMPLIHGLRTVFYGLGAVRLGRGGRFGRMRARVALGVEAGALVAGSLLGTALILPEEGLLIAVEAMLLELVVAAVFPGLPLLLCVRSSREWSRATGA